MATELSLQQAKLLLKESRQAGKRSSEHIRKADLLERRNLYDDDGGVIIAREIARQFDPRTVSRINLLVDESINVLKRVINETSLVYKEEPRRIVVNEAGETVDDQQDILEQIANRNMLNLRMRRVNRLSNLLNHAGILIRGVEGELPKYSIITPDLVTVIQDENNPEEVVGLAYDITDGRGLGSSDFVMIYYDVFGNHATFDSKFNIMPNADNPGNENPYIDPDRPGRTIIPVAWFHKDIQDGAFWDSTGGKDLVNASIQAGIHFTYLNYMFKTTGFPQKYLVGDATTPGKQLFDPLTILHIQSSEGEQPQIGTLQNDFPIKDYFEVLMRKLSIVANNYGIAQSNFRITGDVQSGLSLSIENAAKLDTIAGQIPFYRDGEQELFRLTKIVMDASNSPLKYQDGLALNIDFKEPTVIEDITQENQKWETWIRNGVASRIDWIKSINPDIGENEAEKTLEENLRVNNRRVSQFRGILGNGQNNITPFREGRGSSGRGEGEGAQVL